VHREATSPAAYRLAIAPPQRRVLEAIRDVVRRTAPEIKEGIRYGMLDYPGLANLGAQKHHVALYVSPAVLARHRKSFPGVDSGKSCLRFRRLEQVDAAALQRLLRDVLEHRRR
jgi:uncharacterized protein YdhG (YjbR/CyaY superfamily)